jgi:hypothetical protein
MPIGDYLYLLGGLFDHLYPELTETREEKISRGTREAHKKASAKNKARAKRRG